MQAYKVVVAEGFVSQKINPREYLVIAANEDHAEMQAHDLYREDTGIHEARVASSLEVTELSVQRLEDEVVKHGLDEVMAGRLPQHNPQIMQAATFLSMQRTLH